MKLHVRFITMGLWLLTNACAQSTSQTIPFDTDGWVINADESRIEEYLGRRSLVLVNGSAIIEDSDFTNGIIEFDIAFDAQRGFHGARWRVQDNTNYEEFYMRPHQSGNSDATQYTPVINGLSAWQLYTGDSFGAPITYDFNEWMHVKIVVLNGAAEIYVRNMNDPLLFASDLKRDIQAGKIGLATSETAGPTYFSNFRFVATDDIQLKREIPPMAELAPGTIRSWLISDAFEEKMLDGILQITEQELTSLDWYPLLTEAPTGVANIARIRGVEEGRKTVFAKVTIESDREQVKELAFGFSDRVRCYLNDRLIYAGNNKFRSRDYRFLGTIGYFDTLYLPLRLGTNELILAVSEDFGGWGVMARFSDPGSLRIMEAN